MKKDFRITDANGNRVTAGTLIGEVFYKNVNKPLHLHRNLNSWGIDVEVFLAIRHECTKVVIIDKAENIIYEISYDDALKYSLAAAFREHGLQVFIPLDKFSKRKKEPTEKERLNKQSKI